MAAHILSRSGNVITADFRPRASLDLTVTFESETLYHDSAVVLVRTSARIGDTPFMVLHFLGDLATGRIVQLNHG